MNMLSAMEARRSTRTFDGVRLTDAESAALESALRDAVSESGPFGGKVRLALYAGEPDAKPARLGTYGLISGASAYIVAAAAPGAGSMEDTGYVLEKAVLDLTALGWATCWIGGVFARGKAAEIVALAPGELVPAVIAVGKPSDRRSVADRIVTGSARSRTRKPLDQLVFSAGVALQLEGGKPGGVWTEPLQALRGAPSASNKQPWRLVGFGSGPSWLIFMDEDRIYNHSLGEVHLQNLDIGIGMRHFAEAARSLGLPGRWEPLPGARDEFAAALSFGESRGWTPIALWR
jgi:hypothetical protein